MKAGKGRKGQKRTDVTEEAGKKKGRVREAIANDQQAGEKGEDTGSVYEKEGIKGNKKTQSVR